MCRIAPAARARAERELADIQQVIDNEGGVFARRHGTGFTTASRCGGLPMPLMTRSSNPIFALERVLHDGVFWTASQLWAALC